MWSCLFLLAILAAPSSPSIIPLTDLPLIQSTDVFEGVSDIEFVLGPDPGDQTLAQLALPSDWMPDYRKGFRDVPVCDENDPGRNWLIVDPADTSEFLASAKMESFGQCRWLFSGSSVNTKMLRQIRPAYNSYIFLLHKELIGGTEISTISELYVPSATSRIFEHDIAKFTDNTLTFHTNQSIWDRRSDLDGTRLVVTVIDSPPSLLLPGHDPKRAVGAGPLVIHDWARKFNFTVENVMPARGSYGVRDRNGTWDGMIGDLVSRDADLCPVMTLTQDRAEVVDFFEVVATYGLDLLTKKPDTYSRFSFLTMLDTPVWIVGVMVIAVFVVYSVFLSFVHRDNVEEEFWGYGVMIIYRCLVDQAEPETEKKIASRLSWRILVCTVLFFGFLGINFIAANLTSSMSVYKEIVEINSLEDVVAKGYELFIMGGTSIEQDFITAQAGSTKKTLWDQISKNRKYRERDYRVAIGNFLDSGKAALLIHDPFLAVWMTRNKEVGCTLRMVPLDEERTELTMAARKDLPYFLAFNAQIKRAVEAGTMQKDLADWSAPGMGYVCSTGNEDNIDLDSLGIGLDGTRYFFFLLIVAVGVSLVMAAAEYGFSRWRKRREQAASPRIMFRY